MSLQHLLEISATHGKKMGLSEERLEAQLDNLRNLIAFFREYPDLMIDFLTQNDPDCTFRFYTYQRVFVRCVMRHRFVYATYPRA